MASTECVLSRFNDAETVHDPARNSSEFHRRIHEMDSSSLSFEAFHQAAHVRFDSHLARLQGVHILRNVGQWWQMTALHVRSFFVVVAGKFLAQVIQVPLPEDDELVQTLPADGSHKPLAPAIQVWRSLR